MVIIHIAMAVTFHSSSTFPSKQKHSPETSKDLVQKVFHLSLKTILGVISVAMLWAIHATVTHFHFHFDSGKVQHFHFVQPIIDSQIEIINNENEAHIHHNYFHVYYLTNGQSTRKYKSSQNKLLPKMTHADQKKHSLFI